MAAGRRHLRAVGTKSVRAAIADLSDAHLQCRDFGHAWRPYQAEYVPQRRQYVERLQCPRCSTMRVRLLDSRGAQLANHYAYPDGYQVKGIGRLSGSDRDAVRLASLAAILQSLDESTARSARKRKGA